MGRYGAPRPVRCIFGALIGAGVFAATSVAMFSLAASAGSSTLLGSLSNTVNSVTSGVSNTVSSTATTLTGPSGVVCQVLCSVTNQLPQQQTQQPNPLNSSLPCINGTLCDTQNGLNLPLNGKGGTSGQPTTATGSGPAQSAAAAPNGALGGISGQPSVPQVPAGVGAGLPSLVQPPPPSITLPTATSGINFGKAPFLWPLFLGLDVLGAGAVVLALRKTWSKPAAD